MDSLLQSIGWYSLNGIVFAAGAAIIAASVGFLISYIAEIFGKRTNTLTRWSVVAGLVIAAPEMLHVLTARGMAAALLNVLGILVILFAVFALVAMPVVIRNCRHEREERDRLDDPYQTLHLFT